MLDIAVLLVPYTIVGLGLGLTAGLAAALWLLWKHPAQVLILVLACGIPLFLARAVAERNTLILWTNVGPSQLPSALLGTLTDFLFLMLPAVLSVWAMTAFLLFVLDNAEEVGVQPPTTQAQAAPASDKAQELDDVIR